MFNHGKFNIKRFNLPSADVTDIEYRDDFASALLALVDFGQNVHLQEKQSGDVNAAVIAGALIDASASGASGGLHRFGKSVRQYPRADQAINQSFYRRNAARDYQSARRAG